MKDVKNLLNQVSIISKKNEEFLDATGGGFNLFRITGVNHYENTHSAILAELLNPKGSHGLKSKFLQEFVNQLMTIEIKKDFLCENASVRTEAPGNGRIDILIEDNAGHAIIIENKIYANDQWEQLKGYNEFAIQKYKAGNYEILYLTLNGTEASKNSAENIEYSQISYSYDIIKWLEQCVNLSARFPLVRETINQYINHLKQLTNQDMDTKNKEEIVKILSSSEENTQASFSIFENIDALKDFIILNYFNPQIQEIADELGILVSTKLEGRQKYAGFSFDVPKWKYFYIGFDFEGHELKDLIYYLKLRDAKINIGESILNLKANFQYHNNNDTIPCGYSHMPKYFKWNVDAFLAIRSGEMKKEIKRIIEIMLEQTKDLEM